MSIYHFILQGEDGTPGEDGRKVNPLSGLESVFTSSYDLAECKARLTMVQDVVQWSSK